MPHPAALLQHSSLSRIWTFFACSGSDRLRLRGSEEVHAIQNGNADLGLDSLAFEGSRAEPVADDSLVSEYAVFGSRLLMCPGFLAPLATADLVDS
jgi:hypothetical protein